MEEKNIPLGENNEAADNQAPLAPAEAQEAKPSEEQTEANKPEAELAQESLSPSDNIPDTDKSENAAPLVEPPKNQTTVVYRWDYESQVTAERKAAKKRDHGIRNFAIIMGIAFALAILTLVGVLALGEALPSNNYAGGRYDLSTLYDECLPSYVAISISSEWGASSCGSGIIMTEDGYIATNYHVVDGAADIQVILHDGLTVAATYIDGDELNDIAIIKIEKRGLTPATIGKSSAVRVGEQVMAIGTPYSIQYRGTMTSGYVSALNRKYAAKNDNGTVNKVITLLQTDTSVNPGNSGGPLFNMNGEVIGIVSMKISGSQYEGMGFALPIDGVIDMLNDIIRNGKLTISNGGSAFEGAALGISGFAVAKNTKYLLTDNYHYTVTLDDDGNELVNYISALGSILPIPLADEELLAQYGIVDYTFYTAPESGVLVLETTAGFDSDEKLQINDVIVSANGLSCEKMETLQELVASSRVGDKIELEVFRNGTIIPISIELGRSASMN